MVYLPQAATKKCQSPHKMNTKNKMRVYKILSIKTQCEANGYKESEANLYACGRCQYLSFTMVIDEGVFNGHQIWTECNLFFTINQQLGISFLQNLVYFLQPTKRDEKESEICNKSRWCGSATFSHCEDFFQNTRRSPSNNRSPAPKILQDLARSACPKIKYHHVPTAKINAVKQLKMMFKL